MKKEKDELRKRKRKVFKRNRPSFLLMNKPKKQKSQLLPMNFLPMTQNLKLKHFPMLNQFLKLMKLMPQKRLNQILRLINPMPRSISGLVLLL